MAITISSNISSDKSNTTDYCAAAVLSKNPSASIYVYPSIVLGVVVMVLNVLVVASVIKNKRLHKPAFCYVSSLAVADFVAGFMILYSFLRTFLNNNQTPTLKSEMIIKQGIFICSVGASILSLLVISFNRYFVIVHPFHYRVRMNNVIVGVTLAAIWVYSIVFGALPIAGWNAKNGDCSTIFPGLSKTYVFVLSLHVVVAMVIILVLYTAIFLKVRESSKFRKEALSSEDKAHIKVAKTLFIVSAAFGVCWLPYMTICILDMARSITLAKYTPFFALLAVVNSLLNPIIYACRNNEMRKTFKSILCPCACWRRFRGVPEGDHGDQSKSTCFTFTKSEADVPYERNENSGNEDGACATAESPIDKYADDRDMQT